MESTIPLVFTSKIKDDSVALVGKVSGSGAIDTAESSFKLDLCN